MFLLLIVCLSLLSIFACSAYAAPAATFWDSLFGPFSGLETAYPRFAPFINMIIYLVIFIGLAQWTLGQKFQTGGKAVIVGIGIIFAVGLALWEKSQGINLIIAMGPVAMMVFVALMGFALYIGLSHTDFFGQHKMAAAAIAYFVFFSVMSSMGIFATVSNKVPLIGAILIVLFLLSIITAIWFVMKLFGRHMPLVGGGGGPTPPPAGGGGGAPHLGGGTGGAALSEPEVEKEEKKALKEEKRVFKFANRAEMFAELEEKEFKDALKEVTDSFKEVSETSIAGLDEKEREKLMDKAMGNLEKARDTLNKIARQEKRQITFEIRCRNLANVLKNDLEVLEQAKKGSTAAALKMVEKELKVDTDAALAYGVKLEEKIKEYIKIAGDVLDELNTKKKNKDWANLASEKGKIKGLYDNLINVNKYLLAIISLDERIKKLVEEAEAAEKRAA